MPASSCLKHRFAPRTTPRAPLAVVACGLLLGPLGVLATAPLAAASRPNVIVLMTDDQGYGDLGVHGNRMIRTPHLDRLARQSVRFTNFHVDPTCAETRAALMTGRYATRVGVWHTVMGRSILDRREQTMASFFQRAGYHTAMFGKWHLGDDWPYLPEHRGFVRVLRHGGGGVGQTPDYWGNDYFDDVYFDQGRPRRQTGYCTDVFFAAARRFIRAHRSGPFFCYIATNAPHSPYRVPKKYAKDYLDRGVPPTMANFYGMITNIDENVGRLLELLDELDIASKTLVVFLTDNGTAAGVVPPNDPHPWKGFNAGMRGRKGSPYEGGHRVPCFWYWPGGPWKRDRDIPQLAAHFDLLPTLAELCRLPPPDPARPWDGTSLIPLLEGRPDAFPQRILMVHSQRVDHPQKWRKSSVMSGTWRLVDGKELYDISGDPGQRRDLASAEPERVRRLRAAYERWWQSLQPAFDRVAAIPVGAAQSRPLVLLTAHDWHPPSGSTRDVPWNQELISRSKPGNGYWALDVVRAGRYEITLRNRPPGFGVPWGAGEATIRVGKQTARQAIGADAAAVRFRLDLPSGPTQLRTTIRRPGLPETGAYYVTIRPIERPAAPPRRPTFHEGDRVVWLGAGLLERMQSTGYLETCLLSRLTVRNVTFRNLAWSGDDVWGTARAVFGKRADGFARLRRDLLDARPDMVIVQYGQNEAHAGKEGVAAFERGLAELLDLIESIGARSVIVSPRPMEEIGKPFPDPAPYNRSLHDYCRILRQMASERGAPYIDLFSSQGGRLTDDGIHLTPFGQWRLAHRLARELAGPAPQWKLDIDMHDGSYDATGLLVEKFQATRQGVSLVIRDASLPPVPPPHDAPRNARWLLKLARLRVRHLPAGRYEVRVDGKPLLAASYNQLRRGVLIDRRPGEAQAESLRRQVVAKNALYFHRYRPQNETYLFLFRKHEQGNHAGEVFASSDL